MTIWLDVTTTRGWSRPALGIVRVEVAKHTPPPNCGGRTTRASAFAVSTLPTTHILRWAVKN
jgi:hypothetical protein